MLGKISPSPSPLPRGEGKTPEQLLKNSATAGVLVSGGVDSLALLGWAVRRYTHVQPIYARFGLRWEKAELTHLKKFLEIWGRLKCLPLAVINIPCRDLYANHWCTTGRGVPGYHSADSAVYLPGRNALLLGKAGVFCAQQGIRDLLIGTLKSNPFPDATPGFFSALSRALAMGLNAPLRVLAPFQNLSKRSVVRSAKGVPLHMGFSCLNPRGMRPCLSCNKCAERDLLQKRPGRIDSPRACKK